MCREEIIARRAENESALRERAWLMTPCSTVAYGLRPYTKRAATTGVIYAF